MGNISNNITYKEATKSNTAKRYGIKNEPNDFQLQNMKMVANECFQPLREMHKKAIGISSFLRSKKLNQHPAINGSKTSQHLQGLYSKLEEGAIDIDADIYDNGITNKEIFNWLKDNVQFDQLIWEYGTDKEPAWVHISFRKGANRNMMLTAYKKQNGYSGYSLRK
ncbi:MAG: hypothetical protein HRT69_13875 [Flavobacteriaceae bacterium]|nr:hypothetical protein [Flavobacteriaceae bacterium]